jgi:signal peptidase I
MLKAVAHVLFLPFFVLISEFITSHSIVRRIFTGIVLFPILLSIWIIAYVVFGIFAYAGAFQIADVIGIAGSPIHISGTGSMYPTFPKGTGETVEEQMQEDVAAPIMRRFPGGFSFLNTQFFRHTLKYGDIVSFSNDETASLISQYDPEFKYVSGFVKRVVGLPNDVIEIRDGYLLRNGEIVDEPYTALPRSTFGGEFLSDCRAIQIPENYVFVLGDNRKASNDSRHMLGFVRIQDIDRVLPWDNQKEYQTHWRDSSNDAALSQTPVFSGNEYLTQLNTIRKEHGKEPLKYQQKLEQSARLRATAMLRSGDLSFEATQSGLTMERAMQQVGYRNIIWGEAPTLGYYTADELLENYAQFPEWETFLLDERYEETGIAAVVGEMNGCPVQIVVQHVAGYQPPDYSQDDIESWRTSVKRLEDVQASWENTRSFGSQYEKQKDEYERMISIIHERLTINRIILSRMEENQWLTDEDKELIQKDKSLYTEQENLAKRLNGN